MRLRALPPSRAVPPRSCLRALPPSCTRPAGTLQARCSSTAPSSSLPAAAAAASSSRWPRLALLDQHASQAAPMDVDSEASAVPGPAAPAAPLRQVLPARRLMGPPFTVENIFRSFTMRRVALIRALTTGMPVMYLFGNKDGSWEVKPPETYVPHSEPEPAVGINKARDSMKRHEWLQEVARHSDAWLISISFYFGSFLTAEQR
nr:unnamed protein product [Digitaria exilis]